MATAPSSSRKQCAKNKLCYSHIFCLFTLLWHHALGEFRTIKNWQSADGEDYSKCISTTLKPDDYAYRSEIDVRCDRKKVQIYSADINPQSTYASLLIWSDSLSSYSSGDASKHAKIQLCFTYINPADDMNGALYWGKWVVIGKA